MEVPEAISNTLIIQSGKRTQTVGKKKKKNNNLAKIKNTIRIFSHNLAKKKKQQFGKIQSQFDSEFPFPKLNNRGRAALFSPVGCRY